jgi:hypothetical protein
MSFVRCRIQCAILLAVAAAVARPAPGLTKDAAYERAPFSRYLMADRQAEVALARSAAPKSVSLHATVLVLSRRGYETAAKGSNGFTCLVERSWMSPFDSSEFWNWKMRGPICYNPPASRSVLLYTLRRTNLTLSGLTKAQMLERMNAAFTAKQLPMPAPGSMSYMMAKHQNLGDSVGAWMSHLMFYAPKADGANDGASWGADSPGSPIMLDTSHHVVPEPETIFMIPAAHWSDGSTAPPM